MLVSYPLVNEDGTLNGGEVTFRFSSITSIQHMLKWTREPRPVVPTTEETVDTILGRTERFVIVPNCLTISVNRDEFNVQGDYAELKAKLEQFNEWDDE